MMFEPHVISFFHDVLQWVIGAVVALGVPYIGYLSLNARHRVADLEKDMGELKTEHADCINIRKEQDDLLNTPWPSDANDFLLVVSNVREAMYKAGLKVDQRVVAMIIKNYNASKAKASSEIKALPTPANGER